MLGQGFSLEVLLENVKDHRPSSLVVGSHHYVQLSKFDLSTTKIKCSDLRSVKSIMPTGAAVPSICRQDSYYEMQYKSCKMQNLWEPFLCLLWRGSHSPCMWSTAQHEVALTAIAIKMNRCRKLLFIGTNWGRYSHFRHFISMVMVKQKSVTLPLGPRSMQGWARYTLVSNWR